MPTAAPHTGFVFMKTTKQALLIKQLQRAWTSCVLNHFSDFCNLRRVYLQSYKSPAKKNCSCIVSVGAAGLAGILFALHKSLLWNVPFLTSVFALLPLLEIYSVSAGTH